MRSDKIESLIEALEPVAAQNGYEIVDAEIVGGNESPILRIYIDKADTITLDDISEAQQNWLEDVVDEQNVIDGSYMLEVSSPGIDRPLRTREHFETFAGEDVKIQVDAFEENGRKKYSGKLLGVRDADVMVESEDGEVYKIPLESIQKARVKGKIDFNGKADF